MVMTPWGDSEALRERMLPPGPATPAASVAENQRERVFAAMIACVSERGYSATRVADLVALSGVSTRSFYDLFEDKEACLLATIDALLAGATPIILAAAEAKGDWAAAAIAEAADLIVSHPAAARVCLVDGLSAGPRVARRLSEATASLENLANEIVSKRSSDVPRPIVAAWVGGLQELARSRLLGGRESELPQAFESVGAMLRSYEPPTAALRLSGRPPAPGTDSVEGHDHADRAIRAFIAVVAERGYAEASVEDTLRRASMSATTFYRYFGGKEDALAAAIDSAAAQVAAATLPALRRSSHWGLGVRGAVGAFLNFLAFRPELAHLLLIDYASGGGMAIERRSEGLKPLEGLFDDGVHRNPAIPGQIREAMVACLVSLAGTALRESGARSLPALAPLATHMVLAPFVGSEAATELANGDGGSRAGATGIETIRRFARNPLPPRILELLGERFLPVGRIAQDLDVSAEEVTRELTALEAVGVAESVEGDLGDGPQRLYGSRMRYFETEEWSELSKEERARLSERILDLIRVEVELATRGGTFDDRVDRYLIHLSSDVDEAGWAALTGVYDDAIAGARQVVAEATERLARNGKKGSIAMRGVLMMFEMPQDR